MLASELRWILIGFGIVLLAGIYLWGRRRGAAVASDDAVVRVRPDGRREMPTVGPSVGHTVGNVIEPTLDDEGVATDEPLPARASVDPFMITAVRPVTRAIT